jgi:trehalose 6-phosphate phosphatase
VFRHLAIDPATLARLRGRVDERAFLLDLDGTIVDIAPTPTDVRASASVRRTLARLWRRSGGALALVSGRALADLDRVVAPLQLPAVGGHGAEFRPVAGQAASAGGVPPLDADLKHRLKSIAQLDRAILIEDKDYALALHYRLAPHQQTAIEDAVTTICAALPSGTVEVLPGKAVVEVKAAGFDKGSAVRRLMQMAPFKGRRPIYIGDDTTDESAFAVLEEFDGIGLSVGRVLPGASGHFSAPSDVRAWLEQISKSDGLIES